MAHLAVRRCTICSCFNFNIYLPSHTCCVHNVSGTSTNDDMPEELGSTSRYNFINKMKSYMIWFLRTHGFYGVLIMASYPNIAFDLCGICCGHFLMPFWTFFGATFIGKAVIRNGYQSIIYVMLCR